ncbi:MAG TPA: formate dehydrogenase subunit gamma [Ramlibacter sp.]|jgi:formate dehydrogenase subunit gamma|uniref:formate dehydrogenase subunit gamma n=1 Tax=Ramlibacter sp. TaxID=1917967 RepID=UPI002D3D59E4|nr:formate dehydrogenase subunit gamma [Ramlibacter sp.]HZY18278.1 formate dehydrogenase subunit gamma [Ramlibacter sp.]
MSALRRLSMLLLLGAATLAATAAVPNEDASPAYAEEQTILQIEKDSPEPGWTSMQSGRNHRDRHWIVPIGRESESDLILQRGGNTWRNIRNGPLGLASGAILLAAMLAILLLWRLVGPAEAPPPSGRPMLRFNRTQRIVHWTTAISFLLLALTGVLILFGKKTLLPLIGHDAFSWLAIVSKYVHNVVGPFFIASSVVMFLTFLRDNFFDRSDWAWLRSGGGLFGQGHPPAGYFNAGEKAWFWGGVVLLGLLMSATGLVLDFVVFGQTRYLLQLANYLHIAGATLYIAAAMGHIYLGTVGTPGAYHAMRHGTVDENWARTHHSLWYEKVRE